MTDGAAGSGPDGAGDRGDGDREPRDRDASSGDGGEVSGGRDASSGDGGEVWGGRDASSGDGGEVSAGRDASSGDGGEVSADRDASSGDGGEVSADRDLGGAEQDERLAADSGDHQGAHGAYAVETPEQLLGQVKAVRRRTRFARHAYWFPLVLFGLLTCASIPFYIQRLPLRSGVFSIPGPAGPAFLRFGYLGSYFTGYSAYYWLAAILVGVAATALWYRWRGDRVGLRTPARGYVITGIVLLVLALLIPVLAAGGGGLGFLRVLLPGDLLIRGTFPLVIIGIGLCFLAWAERSIALSVIAAGYLALSLVASLYDIENVFYDLGWNLSPAATGLPNVVLPALVLLLSGAGAWVVQRRQRPLPSSPAVAGPASRAP
jgi:hypothetical protein